MIMIFNSKRRTFEKLCMRTSHRKCSYSQFHFGLVYLKLFPFEMSLKNDFWSIKYCLFTFSTLIFVPEYRSISSPRYGIDLFWSYWRVFLVRRSRSDDRFIWWIELIFVRRTGILDCVHVYDQVQLFFWNKHDWVDENV